MFITQLSVRRCWLGSSPVKSGTQILMKFHHQQHWARLSFCEILLPIFILRRSSILIARYYRFFMYYYALSLRNASFLMVNSSWTKNHVDSILQHSDILLDAIHMLPPLFLIKFFAPRNAPQTAKIVYPPCDTREMAKFSLTNRERTILSVAQFRSDFP